MFAKKQAMRTGVIDFRNVERLHSKELQRRKAVLAKRSTKLLWAAIIVLIIFFFVGF